MDKERVYNFAAGPSTLPLDVLQEAQRDLLNWNGLGMSVMEISHRSKDFQAVVNAAEADLRTLMDIPDNYKVIFCQGGGSQQFASVPLNLLGDDDGKSAAYYVTGGWSARAFAEVSKFGNGVIGHEKLSTYTMIPQGVVTGDEAYVYYCDNETVFGVEFPCPPPEVVAAGIPLVADMSSNILTRRVDVSAHAVIFAGAQKNMGPSGVTVVIVREDLLGKGKSNCPTMLNYKVMADNSSLYNTPPTFSIYMLGLMLRWVIKEGGVEAMEERAIAKSSALYEAIDSSAGFYSCPVEKKFRSRVNVPFRIKGGDDVLEKLFIADASNHNMVALAGHRSVGGMRASLYNALPMAAVTTLIKFMDDFCVKHQE